MKKISEKTLERKLRERVEKSGGKAVKLAGGIETGLPDRLILLPAAATGLPSRIVELQHGLLSTPVTAFAEVKSGGKKLSPRQVLQKDTLERMGYLVGVIDSNEALNEFCKILGI